MEPNSVPDCDYKNVVETLTSMFGNVLTEDVIITVVDSCDGNMNVAVEALMTIAADASSNDTVKADANSNANSIQQPQNTAGSAPDVNTLATYQQNPKKDNHTSTSTTAQPEVTYAKMSKPSGAISKHPKRKFYSSKPAPEWTDQQKKIISYHNQGSRILILLRGAPGSGKTFLAKQIVEILIGSNPSYYRTHIYSTDDYFTVQGVYRFDKYRLSEAHEWNQRRVVTALRQGMSPIIVDNTNIEEWEMKPYVCEGVRNGYYIEVMEPNTTWAKQAKELANRNTHNVPAHSINRMLDNLRFELTADGLMRLWCLSYPPNRLPPVMRTIPAPVVTKIEEVRQDTNNDNKPSPTKPIEMKIDPLINQKNSASPSIVVSQNINEETNQTHKSENENDNEPVNQDTYDTIEKQIVEMEKIEREWENGESWDGESKNTQPSVNKSSNSSSVNPKSARKRRDNLNTSDKLLQAVKKCDDWNKISMLMPQWANEETTDTNVVNISVDKICSSTCVEFGDTNTENTSLKIITATPRDINLYHMSFEREKIPEQRMLDKSTMTTEKLITESNRCVNEEKHFVSFRKLFKNIPRASLRDVFDNCCGDVNWAVGIVLDGMQHNVLQSVGSEDVSDTEEDSCEQCDCLMAYNIIPDSRPKPLPAPVQDNIPETTEVTNSPRRKVKLPSSESVVQLKRQIEKNFVISDNYYSENCLKIRKTRRAMNSPGVESNPTSPAQKLDSEQAQEYSQPSTSKDVPTDEDDDNCSEEESHFPLEQENTVNVHIGHEFVEQLDELFGRKFIMYPKYIVPKFNIPVSLLRELNAYWIESLMHQFDEQDKIQDHEERMLKEDEEFARQLERKEAELAQEGKDPEVPDLKEIMDLDLALSLYSKETMEQWRTKEPNDMAGKMTRDKLYNLFPDMSQDLLSEFLVAYDNNFQATVEMLLMSMGKASVLEDENGLNKFVMQKEMERQEKLLEKEKELCKVEWPLLPIEEKLDMSVVNTYREHADKHLARRNLNHQKAQEYIRRGMTQVASHCSEVAAFHKMKFEQANSLAAATLMQIHAANNPDTATIDLHYLRVQEAKESLDLFLDTHIQKMRETQNGPKQNTLFFITGRGLHSIGGPRVKPAVKKRLMERGIAFNESNPGLLTAKVCAEDRLTCEIS